MSIDKPFALVVEDERDIAALYRHILDVAGYRTEIALHGQVAADRLSNSQPDLVILDLNLPGVSGTQILEMMQKDERLKHTKIIVVTAHAHIASGLFNKPDLLLLKPVSTEQLGALVSRIKISKKAVPLLEKPFDDCTDLYNQPFFVNRLESALKQAKEIEQYRFAVFLFSVDPRNGKIGKNGIEYWEITLRQIAASLKSMLRPTDTLPDLVKIISTF